MEENNVMNEVEVIDNNVEVTDLVTSQDNSNGIGLAEAAVGTFALIGMGFVAKKTYDGAKWVGGKIKGAVDGLKEKRAEKKAAKAVAETEDTEEAPVETSEENE